MANPPPPGTISNLPARPPPPASSSSGGFNRGGFRPAYSASQPQQQPSSYGAAPTYSPSAPPQPPQQHYGAPSYSSYSAPPGAAAASVSARPSYSYPQRLSHQNYGHQSYGTPSAGAAGHAPPSIKNPFPAAGSGSDFDPEMAAQIAQWQSAYVQKDSRDAAQQAEEAGAKPEVPPAAVAAHANADPDNKKTVVRAGGGKKWTDDSLLEWDPSHLRLFVGNLAGETTDESLLKAFSRWESVQKSRVIRDKRTSKSKGYGFVSFSNADDFFAAAKEMNGKYIQSHPVVVRKANTEIKVSNAKDKDRGRKNKNRNRSGNGNGGGSNGGGYGGYEPNQGPYAGAGVTKPGQKTKNGLKLLG